MLELTLRLIVSLAVVVGLLLLLARFGARKFRGQAGALVRVVHRQPLSRTSAVAVVTVGSRVLVLGTTEHQVTILTELEPDELVLPEIDDVDELDILRATEVTDAGEITALDPRGLLAGSVLSPQTWRQAFDVATRAAGRRAS